MTMTTNGFTRALSLEVKGIHLTYSEGCPVCGERAGAGVQVVIRNTPRSFHRECLREWRCDAMNRKIHEALRRISNAPTWDWVQTFGLDENSPAWFAQRLGIIDVVR